MKPLVRLPNRRRPRGQIFWLIAAALPVLLGFVGLGIDLGLAYVTKTTLAKAVDSAALTAMKNVAQGTGGLTCNTTSPAGLAGLQAFDINYTSVPNLTPSPPTPTICFSLDANNNTLVNVTASASISTYFIRIFGASFDTLTVSASAQAQRNPLVMSLVLDVSYSMENNGGSAALPTAVENFVNDFDPNNNDTIDNVSVITFGTSAITTVPNSSPFKGVIDTAMGTNFWGGGVINYTNSQAGLALGEKQILKIAPTPNLLRVLVFFTDGWPNILQDNLTCPAGGTGGKTGSAWLLYCGCDPGDESLNLCNSDASQTIFFTPGVTSNTPPSCNSDNTCNTPPNGTCGGTVTGTGKNATPGLPVNFPDQQTNGTESLSNVTYCGGTAPGQTPSSDAMYRSVLVANDPNVDSYTGQEGLQYQNTYIYAIGMGTAITGQPAAQEFLREVANDPAASTYNSSLPTGEADFTDAADLNTVFQEIASKILLRLAK